MSFNDLWPTSIEEQEIYTIIQERNIKWLCHFTPRGNLESIRKNGLVLRNNLGYGSIVTDNSRFDNHRNAICLSISKPNKWMFERKREQGFDLCLLLIRPEVLFKKKCLFFPHNAATASYRNVPSEELVGSRALEELFSNLIQFQKSGRVSQPIWRSDLLRQNETTSDQAEIQCLENIEAYYIEYIIEYNIPLTYDEIADFVNNQKRCFSDIALENKTEDLRSEMKMVHFIMTKERQEKWNSLNDLLKSTTHQEEISDYRQGENIKPKEELKEKQEISDSRNHISGLKGRDGRTKEQLAMLREKAVQNAKIQMQEYNSQQEKYKEWDKLIKKAFSSPRAFSELTQDERNKLEEIKLAGDKSRTEVLRKLKMIENRDSETIKLKEYNQPKEVKNSYSSNDGCLGIIVIIILVLICIL